MAADRRQQLYDRIRASSKEEVILEEMQRLGFWPQDNQKPKPSTELIKRRGELQRELQELMHKQRLYQNPEEALKAMRKERMAESKKRRIETKKKRLQANYERAKNWHERRQKEILHLGESVSSRLNECDSNREKLEKLQLPFLEKANEVAAAMGLSLAELRFLCYSRDISRISHYQRFVIPKKTGGHRQISAPMPRLKRAQYWILDNILEKIPLHEAAHGFRSQRSIVSNARPHTGANLVINFDLKDFFPTITYQRIKGVFLQMGYSQQTATVFALICSEADTQQIMLDDDRYFVKSGNRHLPQGAPSSPAITNIICRRLDKRLAGAARNLGFTYTRYADDLSFSADRESSKKLGKLQWRLHQIVSEEGFVVHPDKTRIMRSNNQQEVTGIVVNQKPSLDRKTLKRFRALLFQLEKDGSQDKYWGQATNVLSSIVGFSNYIAMVDPDKGRRYREQVARIVKKNGYRMSSVTPSTLNSRHFRQAAAGAEVPREKWWQALERPAPQPPRFEESIKPALEKVSTQEIINQAVAQSRIETTLPRYGWWRRTFVVLKDLFWWMVIVFMTIKLAKVSIFLAFVFLLIAAFFRKALRG